MGAAHDTSPAAAADASPSRHYRYSTAKSSNQDQSHYLTEYTTDNYAQEVIIVPSCH